MSDTAHPPLDVILEAALLVAEDPLPLERLRLLFETPIPEDAELLTALDALRQRHQGRGMELVEVASGYRLQVPQTLAPWLARLQAQRPGRYSRATLETLALIAWRQPISRGEIEAIRGVSLSSQILRSLTDRGWIRVIGHRQVPGRPALYGTTRTFLDDFSLRSLADLPHVASVDQFDLQLPPEVPHNA